jgi:hypothetical protein
MQNAKSHFARYRNTKSRARKIHISAAMPDEGGKHKRSIFANSDSSDRLLRPRRHRLPSSESQLHIRSLALRRNEIEHAPSGQKH